MDEGILEVRNVTKIYGSGRTAVKAVDNVSFSISRGELVLLMGPSGSGKTTLLTLISGLLKPTSGSVKIEGIEITELSQKELARIRLEKIGFIFQHFNLLSALTALENVMIPLIIRGVGEREARKRAEKILSDFGLKDRMHHKPEDLSGGEQQRVAIARAVISDPDLIIADEPTANLDSRKGREVMELIHSMVRKGKAAIIASHDPRVEDFADRVLRMEDGRLKSDERKDT
ncbi:ABC transporter ATP-binding protein [Geoglobus acetivorans]|uniref:ABC transporter, ATP-binding protein n=1 Tax=Geoglobus acetivorans TaxID=565033 RepID=A0A0A7GJK7_GEOAI|nr:ABC transporter, ATP-binding protein [Geoglobus acetivorans]